MIAALTSGSVKDARPKRLITWSISDLWLVSHSTSWLQWCKIDTTSEAKILGALFWAPPHSSSAMATARSATEAGVQGSGQLTGQPPRLPSQQHSETSSAGPDVAAVGLRKCLQRWTDSVDPGAGETGCSMNAIAAAGARLSSRSSWHRFAAFASAASQSAGLALTFFVSLHTSHMIGLHAAPTGGFPASRFRPTSFVSGGQLPPPTFVEGPFGVPPAASGWWQSWGHRQATARHKMSARSQSCETADPNVPKLPAITASLWLQSKTRTSCMLLPGWMSFHLRRPRGHMKMSPSLDPTNAAAACADRRSASVPSASARAMETVIPRSIAVLAISALGVARGVWGQG